MPDQPQEDVTFFKARTHHGSGKKETYELKVRREREAAAGAASGGVTSPATAPNRQFLLNSGVPASGLTRCKRSQRSSPILGGGRSHSRPTASSCPLPSLRLVPG